MVRLRAVAAIESSPRMKYEFLETIVEGLENQVEQLRDDQTPGPSMVALLRTIASTDRDAAAEFLSGLIPEGQPIANAELAMLAVDAMGQMGRDSATDVIAGTIGDPAFDRYYAFRHTVADALWTIRTPAAMEQLKRLRGRLDGQLRADIDRMLKEVAAEKVAAEKVAAAKVAAEQIAAGEGGEDGSVRQTSFDDSANRPLDLTRGSGEGSRPKLRFVAPEYYGIPIEAKRVLFVLDHSGSMREPTAGGVTRLRRAKEELIYAIQSLPPDREFALMIFSNRTRLWRRKLAVADRQNKVEAITFVREIGLGDRTNTYAALSLSLVLDDSLEAVYLLTDGKPTLGSLVRPDQIVADITHRNRFRHLRLHTIGVAVAGGTKMFLQTLAARSDGEFREVH